MAVVAPPTLTAQLRQALTQVRMSRHHPDCRCGTVKGGYCSVEERLWSSAVDRILESIRKATF